MTTHVSPRRLVAVIVGSILIPGCLETSENSRAMPGSGPNVVVNGADRSPATLATASPPRPTLAPDEYDLDAVRAGDQRVPRLVLATVPSDLDEMASAEARKSAFLAAVLPAVLHVNERIQADRRRLIALADEMRSGAPPSPRDSAWLAELSREYQSDGDIDELLRRVDIVPPSLALAQSAIESGWGTSRFARVGNALFGQRGYDGNGMVAQDAADPDSFRVLAFDHTGDSVAAYARNLNTHAAYEALRQRRAALRESGDAVTGAALAETLVRYSERGEDYVQDVIAIIRVNDLAAFDRALLVAEDGAGGSREASGAATIDTAQAGS